MIEAYKIGMSLVMTSNVARELNAAMRQFEMLNRVIKDTQINVNELAAGMRGLSRLGANAAAEWRGVAAAMERAAKASRSFGGGAAGPGRPGPSAAASSAAAAAASTSGAAASLYLTDQRRTVGPYLGTALGAAAAGGSSSGGPASVLRSSVGTMALMGGTGGPGGIGPYNGGGAPPYGRGPIPLNLGPMGPGGGISYNGPSFGQMALSSAIPAYGGYEVLKAVAHPTVEAGNILARMRAARFTDDDISRSKAMANGLVGSVPGMGYAKALDLINQTASFTGDVHEALTLTPSLARNAQVLGLFGKHDAISQVESAIKAGELTGLNGKDGHIDTAKLIEFVNNLTTTVVAGGGTLDINKYLTGMRQFGAGASAADKDFLTNVLPAYMKIMGEVKAGTAMQSLQQSFLSARPNTQNKALIQEQQRLGLRGKDGKLSPEDADLLATSPDRFIVERILPALRAQGITDTKSIRAKLPSFLPRATMERLVSAGIFDEDVIGKEAARNRAQQTAGGAPLDALLRESPGNQIASFAENLHLLETMLGDAVMGPAARMLSDLTQGLRGISDWARDNPEAAGRALTAFAEGVALFGATAAAGLAMKLMTGPAGFIALAVGIETLGGALKNVPQWLIDMAAGAAAGGRVGGVPGAMIGGIGLPAARILGTSGPGIVSETPGMGALGQMFPGLGIVKGASDWLQKTFPSSYSGSAPGMPPVSGGQPATTNIGNVDELARAVGNAAANGTTTRIERGLSRQSTGTSGFDPRMSTPGMFAP